MHTQEPRRRAAIPVNPRMLASLLDLPEGLSIVGVYAIPDPMSIRILVEGDQLAECPPDSEAPLLAGSLTGTRLLLHEDQMYARWPWSRWSCDCPPGAPGCVPGFYGTPGHPHGGGCAPAPDPA